MISSGRRLITTFGAGSVMRLRTSIPLIAAAVVAALALPACALTSPMASSVNSSNISDAWLDQTTAAFVGSPLLQSAAGLGSQQPVQQGQAPPELPVDDLKRQILTREIFTQMLEGEIYKAGADPTQRIAEARDDFEVRLRSRAAPDAPPPNPAAVEAIARWAGVERAFVDSVTPETPTTETLQAIYDKIPLLGQKLCMSVIEVTTPAAAQKVSQRVAAKESFGQIAADLSEDLNSKPRKGDVGCITAQDANQKRIDPAVFRAAAQTKPGSVSPPVQGDGGGVWFVRHADQGSTGADFESAVPNLIAQYNLARNAMAQERYQDLASSSDVTVVCPLGQWADQGPFAQNPMIVPCGIDPLAYLAALTGGGADQGAPPATASGGGADQGGAPTGGGADQGGAPNAPSQGGGQAPPG